MSAQTNLELMRSMLAPLAEGDARAFVRGFTDDIAWTVIGSTPWSRTYRGKEALRNDLFGPVMSRFKQPYRVAIKHLSAAGDFVAAELHGVGNTTLEGRDYPQKYVWICRLEAGRLKEVTEYADLHLAMEVVGPPSAQAG